jgi:hypothetical protein
MNESAGQAVDTDMMSPNLMMMHQSRQLNLISTDQKVAKRRHEVLNGIIIDQRRTLR